MARGFGSTLGVGTTDAVTSAYTGRALQKTIHIAANRNGAGGANFGRLWEQASAAGANRFHFFHDQAASRYQFQVDGGSGGTAGWHIPSPATGSWRFLTVVYDGGSQANDPTIYLDGVAQAATLAARFTAGEQYTAVENAFVIGNRPNGDRVWDGQLAEFAVWEALLDADEVAALGKGYSPDQIRPASLVEYIPMIRANVSRKLSAPSIIGTAVQPHPRVILPRRRTIISVPAAGGGTTVTATGVSGTGDIGTVTATGGALVQPTGLSASGDIGTVTVGIVETVSATGVSASGAVGTATVTGGALAEPAGVSATGSLGSVTVAAGTVVEATGVSAQGQVGTVTTAYDMAFPVSGVSGTGDIGTVTISGVGDATANATGVQAVGNIGSVTVAADHALSVSGVSAEGRTGTVAATGGATVAVSGVSADGQVGTATVLAGEVVSVSGVSAAGTVGTPTVTTGALAALAGVQAVGRVGNVGVLFDMAVSVSGVSAVGKVSSVITRLGVAFPRGPITPAIARGPITPAIARGPITPATPRA